MSLQSRVARIIRTERASKGFSQQELADKTGLSQNTISKAERGESDMSLSNCESALDVLGYSINIDKEMSNEDIETLTLPAHSGKLRIGDKYYRTVTGEAQVGDIASVTKESGETLNLEEGLYEVILVLESLGMLAIHSYPSRAVDNKSYIADQVDLKIYREL